MSRKTRSPTTFFSAKNRVFFAQKRNIQTPSDFPLKKGVGFARFGRETGDFSAFAAWSFPGNAEYYNARAMVSFDRVPSTCTVTEHGCH